MTVSGDAMRSPSAKRPRRGPGWDVLAVIATGGAIGALARYAIGLAWPTPSLGFPWATFVINLIGCALIGVLMVLITEVRTPGRLLRPFAGTGLLGGFTTFSTYAVDVEQLIRADATALGLIYLAATPVCALLAVSATVLMIRWVRRRV